MISLSCISYALVTMHLDRGGDILLCLRVRFLRQELSLFYRSPRSLLGSAACMNSPLLALLEPPEWCHTCEEKARALVSLQHSQLRAPLRKPDRLTIPSRFTSPT